MNRIFMGAALCALACACLEGQSRTIDDKNCHLTVPADWKQVGPHSAQATGAPALAAVVRSITPEHYKATVDLIKQGQMANLKPKILDDNTKRVLIQTELQSPNGKTTTHYQLMTKSSAGCQGSVDFSDPSQAAAARKIVESTTGAQ